MSQYSQTPGRLGPLAEQGKGPRAWAMDNGSVEFADDGLDLVEMTELRHAFPGAAGEEQW